MALFGKGEQSSSFGKGQQSSGFGAKPAFSSQKPLTQRPPITQKPIPSKPTLTKPAPPKQVAKKPAPQKPQTFFGEKKDWKRQDFINRVAKDPFSLRGRKGYSFYERKKMLEKTFSPGRFSTYISDREAKQRLRELRREAYNDPKKRAELDRWRKYIEEGTDLHGNY